MTSPVTRPLARRRTCLRLSPAITQTVAHSATSRQLSFSLLRGVPAHTVRDMERLVYEHVDLLLEKYDEHHQPGNRSHGDESLD